MALRLVQTIALITLTIFLGGCIMPETGHAFLPTLQIVDVPPLGEVRTAELGETTVEKAKVYTFDAIDLKNKITAGDGLLVRKVTISPGVLVEVRETDQYRFFQTDQATVFDPFNGSVKISVQLAVGKRNPDPAAVRVVDDSLFEKPSEVPQFAPTKVNAVNEPYFKQEFIYNGRAGDSVKFLYREFSNDYIRPAFSQDVQYDLKEGSTIGFKGLRLEVLNATNTKLEYRVINSFPDHN